MFDLANDRLSYSEMLRPDVGYTLEFAVGTTYSLDLEALLGIPVSMGLLEDGDTEQLRNPLYVLESIRASSDKIAIFCNAGGIKLPDRIQSVYSLLEESVFQVKLGKNANFHPKLWVASRAFSSCEIETRCLLDSPLFPFPLFPATVILLSVSGNLTTVDISRK